MLPTRILKAVVRDGIARPTGYALIGILALTLLVTLTCLALAGGSLVMEFGLEVTGTSDDTLVVLLGALVVLFGAPTFGCFVTVAIFREVLGDWYPVGWPR